jgi:hypothetical protein
MDSVLSRGKLLDVYIDNLGVFYRFMANISVSQKPDPDLGGGRIGP